MPRINSSSFTSHNLISIYKQTALVHFYLFVYVYRATCMNVSERTTRAVVKFQKFYFWISCLCHCCWCFAHSFEKNMSFRWKNHHHLLTFGAVYISDNDIRLLSDERKLTAHFMLKTAPLYQYCQPLTCLLGTDWTSHLVCYAAAKYHWLIVIFNVKCTHLNSRI